MEGYQFVYKVNSLGTIIFNFISIYFIYKYIVGKCYVSITTNFFIILSVLYVYVYAICMFQFTK